MQQEDVLAMLYSWTAHVADAVSILRTASLTHHRCLGSAKTIGTRLSSVCVDLVLEDAMPMVQPAEARWKTPQTRN
nr:hypothetical protein CFP56_42060 [Quercus suber]